MVLRRIVVLTSVRHLRPNARNVRRHTKRQIGQIADSIARFGWTVPILVDEKSQILAGHGRYEAAMLLGLDEVPVIVISGLNDAEKRALALGDNKIAANAGWDRKALKVEVCELARLLPQCGLDITITGFQQLEIALNDELVVEQPRADESAHKRKQPVSRSGDEWLLGWNRLFCGEASDGANAQSEEFNRALLGIDAAVRCWQRFTKHHAILVSTNAIFDDVAAARSKRARRKP